MSVKTIKINLNAFNLAYLSTNGETDRDDFLRGMALGMNGGEKIAHRSSAFQDGFRFGNSAFTMAVSDLQKYALAGSKSALARDEKYGSAQPRGGE